LFSRFLKSAGAKVNTADDGSDGISAFLDAQKAGQNYDAIIMDIRMPVMDGYQAARNLRELGFHGPIIALTAHAVPGEESRCLGAGCSHFLTKPVDRTQFNETLSRALTEIESRSTD
jgi:CheY-like chemotaxis protein